MSAQHNIVQKRKLPQWLERTCIILILFFYFIAGILYTINTPIFEASDELWHYPMVHHLADGNPLPVQTYDPSQAGPWKQEASQPPLYYYVSAVLVFWIDRSEFDAARDLNPHVDTGKITTDGNINLAVQNPSLSSYAGTYLAVRLIRLFSIILGLITIILTYLIAQRVTPNRSDIPLLAAGLNAFTPMFVFISGSVNNDNLAIPLASLGILLLINLMQWSIDYFPAVRGEKDSAVSLYDRKFLRRLIVLGSVVGLAVLTKQGTIGLLPLTWGTLFLIGWQSSVADYHVSNQAMQDFLAQIWQALRRSFIWFAIFFAPILIIAGWWYVRNIQLYGDLLGWSAFEAVLGVRETPASLAQLWDERWGFMLSYWGLFGGLNVPMSDWIYRLMTAVLILAIPGGIWFAVQEIRLNLWWGFAWRKENSLADRLSALLNLVVSNFPLVVLTLFSFAIVYGLTQWATKTWSSQGRLVFTAISALNILMAIGLATLLDFPIVRQLKTGIVLFFAAVTLVAPPLFIAPAYVSPAYTHEEASIVQEWISRTPSELESGEELLFNNSIRLVGVQIGTDSEFFRPGDTVPLKTEWFVQRPTDTDWSVFIHLIDPVLGVPVAQRDMYPGQGLVATSFSPRGTTIPSHFDIQLSDTLLAPAELDLRLGLYNFETKARATLPNGEDSLLLGTIQVAAKEGETPNPISINFESSFELVGFELDQTRVSPGDTIIATAYWKLIEPVSQDYTFFGQIVGEDTTRWAPVDLQQPTTTWEVGKIQRVEMELTLRDDTPLGVYPLRLGVYESTEEGGIRNLQRITPDGRLTDDFINLTKVRVD